jgi:hypothetical protein
MNDDLREVHMVGVPVELAHAAQQHFDELSREFLHLSNSEESVRDDVPGRLLAVSDALRARFSSFSEANSALIDEAIARGDARLDLTYRIPVEAADAAEQLAELLDEADRYCATGDYLLTLRTPPGALAYRQWYLGQFVGQLRGADPVAFDDWAAASSPAPPST